MYVPFFRCGPVLSLRVISLHLPSCRLVPLCFVSLSFPLHSPCFHFCPFHVPFSSPLCSVAFLSCRHFLFPPLMSLHFLAFPLCSPLFPRFSAKGGRKPKPAKSRQGEWSLGPLFCNTGSPKTTFSGTSSNFRAVRGPPPPTYQMLGGGGGG